MVREIRRRKACLTVCQLYWTQDPNFRSFLSTTSTGNPKQAGGPQQSKAASKVRRSARFVFASCVVLTFAAIARGISQLPCQQDHEASGGAINWVLGM